MVRLVSLLEINDKIGWRGCRLLPNITGYNPRESKPYLAFFDSPYASLPVSKQIQAMENYERYIHGLRISRTPKKNGNRPYSNVSAFVSS